MIRLVCDAMRHWVTVFGVDGFRIDLASVLGRPHSRSFDPNAPLLTAIAVDPVLSRVKLIAEPWDATGEGYRVGGFGVAWSEWNGRFRDAVRDFWRGHGGIGEVASRLTGSSDLYAASGRRPWASVNFVTAHDGFTLRDLVSYERKHNEANGEDNRDGTDDNRSQNFGVEGETASADIVADRLGTARALLGTLLLSTGTPMLLGGDERWRTQGGNNNAYCRDDGTSWVDWAALPEAESLTAFVARLTAIRRSSPDLHRDRFYRDGEVLWWHPAGRRIGGHDWHDGDLRTLGLLRGEWLLLLHAGGEPIAVRPAARRPVRAGARQHPPDGVPVDREPLAGGERRCSWRPARCCSCARRDAGGPGYGRSVPRYDFRCRQCAQTFEVTRPMSASGDPATCPAGHADTVKLLPTVAVGGRSGGAPMPPCGPQAAVAAAGAALRLTAGWASGASGAVTIRRRTRCAAYAPGAPERPGRNVAR